MLGVAWYAVHVAPLTAPGALLSLLDSVVAGEAKRLPVRLVEEETSVPTVWDAMVNDPRCTTYAEL
jgi:hypothetical protein